MTLKKKRRSKSNLDPKLCQFLYFIRDVIFDNLSELQQTTIETSVLPTICSFKRSNPILSLNFQNSVIFISFVMSLSKLSEKDPKLYIMYQG